jgi:hypothetical protein
VLRFFTILGWRLGNTSLVSLQFEDWQHLLNALILGWLEIYLHRQFVFPRRSFVSCRSFSEDGRVFFFFFFSLFDVLAVGGAVFLVYPCKYWRLTLSKHFLNENDPFPHIFEKKILEIS